MTATNSEVVGWRTAPFHFSSTALAVIASRKREGRNVKASRHTDAWTLAMPSASLASASLMATSATTTVLSPGADLHRTRCTANNCQRRYTCTAHPGPLSLTHASSAKRPAGAAPPVPAGQPLAPLDLCDAWGGGGGALSGHRGRGLVRHAGRGLVRDGGRGGVAPGGWRLLLGVVGLDFGIASRDRRPPRVRRGPRPLPRRRGGCPPTAADPCRDRRRERASRRARRPPLPPPPLVQSAPACRSRSGPRPGRPHRRPRRRRRIPRGCGSSSPRDSPRCCAAR